MKEMRIGLKTNKQIIMQRKESSKHNDQTKQTDDEWCLAVGGARTGLTNKQKQKQTNKHNKQKKKTYNEWVLDDGGAGTGLIKNKQRKETSKAMKQKINCNPTTYKQMD